VSETESVTCTVTGYKHLDARVRIPQDTATLRRAITLTFLKNATSVRNPAVTVILGRAISHLA
jgi:hypothetical protein